ncbi:MAG: glycosyltransferase family 1 protein [Mediterranea sp.]|jgi:glycosyltransferase involved in cell wall biosynthesis|nr:glycosyltransferase family 1 protein [Mediterranea sp.]
MKVIVYPQIISIDNVCTNPYLADVVRSLEMSGVHIGNRPDKNPLFSLIFKRIDNDAYIFHWLENVPNYKHGILQTIAAIYFVGRIKCHRKTLVWFLHNKEPHVMRHPFLSKMIVRLLLRKADLIVTHSTDGIELICREYPPAVSRILFTPHPTKNRIRLRPDADTSQTDLLIWGSISPYKGVLEFARFAAMRQLMLRIKIIGRCTSPELWNELMQYAGPSLTMENRAITFDELADEIGKARFVLIPYDDKSVLDSSALMDSLSFGAKVIGPDTGAFKDYASEPLICVYTFRSFDDIPVIVQRETCPANMDDYRHFLDKYNWKAFGKLFSERLHAISTRASV